MTSKKFRVAERAGDLDGVLKVEEVQGGIVITVRVPSPYMPLDHIASVKFVYEGSSPQTRAALSKLIDAMHKDAVPKCQRCRGSGTVISDSSLYDERDCPACGGSGKGAEGGER